MPDFTAEAQAQELANSSGSVIVIFQTNKGLLYTRREHLKDVLKIHGVLRFKYLYPATWPWYALGSVSCAWVDLQ